MNELPYFGKALCECGVRSATNLHFEIHNLKHLVDDVSEQCSNLMAYNKQEDEELQTQIENFQDRVLIIKNTLQSIINEDGKMI